jgi:dTDP-4-dehydrorhamnose reductase
LRILVTGGSSTPGYKLVLKLAERGYDVYAQYYSHEIPEIPGVRRVRLDLRDSDKIIDVLGDIKPSIIIHTAAVGDVDLCETNRDFAWRVNVEATKAISRFASRNRSFLVYLSTDYVFDGERGMYREEDTPNPVNYYGLTKLVAEGIVASSTEDHVIVRASHIYGFGMGRVNFARHVVESLSKGQPVRALVDQWLSPTLNTLLAEAIVEIVEKGLRGLFHIAGERVSRYDFARAIARRFGFKEDLIEPITSRDIVFKARRPRDSSLNTEKAKQLLKTPFHSLDHSLEILYREWLSARGV